MKRFSSERGRGKHAVRQRMRRRQDVDELMGAGPGRRGGRGQSGWLGPLVSRPPAWWPGTGLISGRPPAADRRPRRCGRSPARPRRPSPTTTPHTTRQARTSPTTAMSIRRTSGTCRRPSRTGSRAGSPRRDDSPRAAEGSCRSGSACRPLRSGCTAALAAGQPAPMRSGRRPAAARGAESGTRRGPDHGSFPRTQPVPAGNTAR